MEQEKQREKRGSGSLVGANANQAANWWETTGRGMFVRGILPLMAWASTAAVYILALWLIAGELTRIVGVPQLSLWFVSGLWVTVKLVHSSLSAPDSVRKDIQRQAYLQYPEPPAPYGAFGSSRRSLEDRYVLPPESFPSAGSRNDVIEALERGWYLTKFGPAGDDPEAGH